MLDPQLATLLRDVARHDPMPLAVTRFVTGCGAEDAIAAIRLAASRVLAAYAERFTWPTPVVSATRLCELCDVELRGSPRPGRARSPVYALDAGPVGAKTQTASFHVEGSKAVITIARGIDVARARVGVAHEIGHLLVHTRGASLDADTLRLPSTPVEETLAEYAARLLLLPNAFEAEGTTEGIAKACVSIASVARVTVHSAAARLGDPDRRDRGIRSVVFWRLNHRAERGVPVARRLVPQWHLSGDVFVPIGRCHARSGSLIAELAGSSGDTPAAGSAREHVSIGSLHGELQVDAFAWGSVEDGTRVVLAVFSANDE